METFIEVTWVPGYSIGFRRSWDGYKQADVALNPWRHRSVRSRRQVDVTGTDISLADSMTASRWDVPLGTAARPSWRGRLHLVTLLVAVPLCALVALDAHDTRARVGVVVYAAGLCSMLAVSTTYHRWVHTIRARTAWRRADHATIFVAIAGTATPLCLASRSAAWPLGIIWTLAIVGVVAKATGSRRG